MDIYARILSFYSKLLCTSKQVLIWLIIIKQAHFKFYILFYILIHLLSIRYCNLLSPVAMHHIHSPEIMLYIWYLFLSSFFFLSLSLSLFWVLVLIEKGCVYSDVDIQVPLTKTNKGIMVQYLSTCTLATSLSLDLPSLAFVENH